jgi:hypothetical protein
MIVRVLVKRGVDRRYRLEKSWHFGKFAERNHTNNKSEGHGAQSRRVLSPTALAATLERARSSLDLPVDACFADFVSALVRFGDYSDRIHAKALKI